MKIDIYKDGVSYVTDGVSSIPTSESNLSEFTRAKFVTDLAAVSRGKEGAKNPESRYKALLKEAAPTYEEAMKAKTFYTCPKCGDDCKTPIANITTPIVDSLVQCESCEIICYAGDSEQPDGYNISEWDYKIKGSPSRPLEFLPIVVGVKIIVTSNFCEPTFRLFNNSHGNYISSEIPLEELMKGFGGTFGYMDGHHLYTNMRACINAGIPYDLIPYNTPEELKDFRALKANVPMFVFNHLVTHTALSKEAQSDRVTKSGKYWLPSDFRIKVYNWLQVNPYLTIKEAYESDRKDTQYSVTADKLLSCNDRDEMISFLLTHGSQQYTQDFFQAIGYKKEIYQRAMLEFRYKEVVMTAWNNHPKAFYHFTLEREAFPDIHKSWVQEQTKLLAEAIRDIVV